ncbi:MAG: hypothetical protein HY956_04000 [Deltaproteobacteria bacterium]|nr:hypothetical protein [Deltaproteobacteria bacterium]
MKLIFYLVILRFLLRIFPASMYAGAMIREDLERPPRPDSQKDGEKTSTKDPPEPEG